METTLFLVRENAPYPTRTFFLFFRKEEGSDRGLNSGRQSNSLRLDNLTESEQLLEGNTIVPY